MAVLLNVFFYIYIVFIFYYGKREKILFNLQTFQVKMEGDGQM